MHAAARRDRLLHRQGERIRAANEDPALPLTLYGWKTWTTLTVICAVVAGGLVALGWWWAVIAVTLPWLFVLWFFRDPIRRVPQHLPEGAMLSSADGRVSAVLTVDEHEVTGGPAVIVRVFLSVLNVHVNRAPCAGEVTTLKHTPGRFFDARTEESAQLNENNLITLRLPSGEPCGVKQIAGKVARRIVCPLRVGDRLERGQKFGMIQFGSTTELILPRPDDVAVKVKVGDRVKGGLTVVAVLNAETRGDAPL